MAPLLSQVFGTALLYDLQGSFFLFVKGLLTYLHPTFRILPAFLMLNVRSKTQDTRQRGEWPSDLASSISLIEVKYGCVRAETGWATLPDEQPKQLIPPSFGRDVKRGVPCLDSAYIVRLG